MTITLKQLLEKHPEYANLTLVVYNHGLYNYIEAAGECYPAKDYPEFYKSKNYTDKTKDLPENVLVIASN